MKMIFQLWGLESEGVRDRDTVLGRVETVLRAKPWALVAGQNGDSDMLRRICDMAHAAGVKVFQWASLFSEYDDAADFDPIIGADGHTPARVFGEHFNFRCPGSARNVELLIQMQQKSMQGIPFDGVFLDRVRYPSFAAGGLNALTCFCPDCMRRYEQAGVDAEKVRAMLLSPAKENPLTLTGFEGGGCTFADADMAGFFAVRAQNVARAVKRVGEALGPVGLDLFPPEQAYLAGQSLELLAPLAAFVKPMLYRVTTAPAGLPFEREAYEAATGHSLRVSEARQVRMYEAIAGGRLFWGVEGARVPDVAHASPDSIRRAADIIARAGGNGMCASWNTVAFPQENLDAFLSLALCEQC